MTNKVLIFGKDTWPYTIAAREAYVKAGKDVDYIPVLTDPEKLKTMLSYTDGARQVPVIVENDHVTIGYKGETWGI